MQAHLKIGSSHSVSWILLFFLFHLISELKYRGINSKVRLATVVEGDHKAPFSIATTTRCWRGRYFFPWITPLYL